MTVSVSELARQLGISRAGVLQRLEKGMPREIAAAIAWTHANIDPSRGRMPPGVPRRIPSAPTIHDLAEAALDDWLGNRLPLLAHLAQLDAAAVRSAGVDLAVWERVHRDFVESPAAWPLMIRTVLELAEAGNAGAS